MMGIREFFSRGGKNIYSQFISKDDLCFDIGANLGNRTDQFLSLDANVVAVEPQEACVKILAKKYQNNPKVTVLNCAAGEATATTSLFICEKSPTISTMSERWKNKGRFSKTYEWGKEVQVGVVTLDELIRKYGQPRFCKIDVEGYEFRVIKGLSKTIDVISFEFTVEFIEEAVAIVQHLRTLGKYRFNYSLGESLVFAMEQFSDDTKLFKSINTDTSDGLWGDIYAYMGDDK